MKRPVLLFDIMSTVVYDPIFKELPGFFGLSLQEFFHATRPGAWIDFELGVTDEAETFRTFFQDGRAFDGDAFKACVQSAYRFIDDTMEPLLAELSDAGYEIHALSNYPEWYRMIEAQLKLSRFLKWSFVSCRMGVRKPDRAIYTQACETLGVTPTDALFVDDREVNCEGARNAGLHAIRFENTAQLREELRRFGIA